MNDGTDKVSQAVEEAVKEYAMSIVEAARDYMDIGEEIEIDFDPCNSANGKHTGSQATITSDLGVVVVFPDFKKKGAKACIVNLGLINAMQMEGFEDGYIEQEGKIYSELLPFNKDNVETFAYYLTHKIERTK